MIARNCSPNFHLYGDFPSYFFSLNLYAKIIKLAYTELESSPLPFFLSVQNQPSHYTTCISVDVANIFQAGFYKTDFREVTALGGRIPSVTGS